MTIGQGDVLRLRNLMGTWRILNVDWTAKEVTVQATMGGTKGKVITVPFAGILECKPAR
jgi:hypothetical protein